MAIQSFPSPALEPFFREGRPLKGVGWANVARIAARKLDMLDYAVVLSDLASPPGNRLEALRGDSRGSHSMRIDDQWRVVLRWTDAGAAVSTSATTTEAP
jgi:proteic killer suppression protein